MNEDNNPSSPFFLIPMKLNKFVFLMPMAVDKVSRRFGIDPPIMSHLFVLYSIQYMPFDCTQSTIVRHAQKYQYPIVQSGISAAVRYWISCDMVRSEGRKLSLTPRGREYLSAIRRYLLNQRLS